MFRHFMSVTLLLSLNSTSLRATEGEQTKPPLTADELFRTCLAALLGPMEKRISDLEREVDELRQALNESQSISISAVIFTPVPQDIEALLESELKEFTFPGRIATRIQELGLYTVNDLARLKSTDFIVAKLVSKQSLEVIEIFLKQFGRNFADLKQPGLAPEPDSRIYKALFFDLVDAGLMSRKFSQQGHSQPKLTLGEFLSRSEKEIMNGKNSRDSNRDLNGARAIFAKYRRVLLP